MSLRLLVDEDSQPTLLLSRLRAAGHDVISAGDAGLEGHADSDVLAFARAEKRLLLTRNCGDFQILHSANPDHAGILAVYQDRDPAKNLSYSAIVQALERLDKYAAAAEWSLQGQFIIINLWRQ